MAILSSDQTYVTVEKGDTLSEIAQDYKKYSNNASYKTLAAINRIPNPDLIYIGQKIKLVGSSASITTKDMAEIDHFGLQAGVDKSLFATWTWWRHSSTEHYELEWSVYTKDNVWLPTKSTTEYRYSVYTIPANTKQVRFRVKPVSKTTKSKDGKTEQKIFTAKWTSWKTHKVVDAPSVPATPTVSIDGLKLSMEVNNVKSPASIIEFEIVKDNATVVSTQKVAVTTQSASFTYNVVAGGKYKVRCRANGNGIYSDWSAYSSNFDTVPTAPSKLTKCEAASETSIHIEWGAVSNATSYDIEYATEKKSFDTSSNTTVINDVKVTSWDLTGIKSGQEYFFRVRASNDRGDSGWSEISSTTIGTGPAAPTTWSSTTTAIIGDPLSLYWVHNSKDGSSQSHAVLELYFTGSIELTEAMAGEMITPVFGEVSEFTVDSVNKKITYTIKNSTNEEEKDKTSSCTLDTSKFTADVSIRWQVKTAGVTNVCGEYSTSRFVNVYDRPSLDLTIESLGTIDYVISSFPINISAVAGPAAQKPIGYHLTISAVNPYETVDDRGNTKFVNSGDSVYSKYFDISDNLNVTLSAGDLSLENGEEYTITCTVSMDSGLSATSSRTVSVDLSSSSYTPTAEISIDTESLSASIRPYVATYIYNLYKVTLTDGAYSLTTTIINSVFSDLVPVAYLATGEPVYYGTTDEGEETYYCGISTETYMENFLLAVYRREFDGSFTEIASGLDAAKNSTVVDPHPALDYARYRIVATSKSNGAVTYYDTPGYELGEKSAIIQWNEEWVDFDVNGENPEQRPWAGSLLKLPYNLDISEKHNPDVSLIEYIGRERPVSYYGTQRGETCTWSVDIAKSDIETLYALRRLKLWRGDVYVREPSGTGYWATINVTFNRKHRELTIPVSIEITRVEGGK